jgi:uncharacterized membrane protein YagU involved in acid resistance
MPETSIPSRSFVSALPLAILGGFAATVVFTLVARYVAPVLIGHPMDVPAVLGGFTGLGATAGLVIHFVIGTLIFPIAYLIVAPFVPGAGWVRGVAFMVAMWLLAALIVMPVAGVGLFFGGAREAVTALIGHIVFGAILGAVAPLPHRSAQ